jgi:hypothetical protein
MTDFPDRGDNFVLLGDWRVLEGSAWHDWQRNALRAQISASEVAGEPFAARRLRARLERLTAGGPTPVALPQDPQQG